MAAVTSAASAYAARIGAALSDAQYFESSMVRVNDIRTQLDSRSVKDKLDAMKRVIALISLGKDASTFFPDVVKNVVAPSLEVKKLVYLYLVHYAEEKQDLALLAINSFQKDLSDHNQHIRALSLRVLSSIRVKVILQVVILAITKAAKDSSSLVRKVSAHAIGKVCALDTASKESLLEPLQDLISDRSTLVMGSAIAAFEDVCPHNWSLIHPHYRRICVSLVDVDPWGQIIILQMLLRYARFHFAYPYADGAGPRNADLDLMLRSVQPLFFSMNYAVVASAISLFYHLATNEEFCANAIKPLMRLVSICDDGGQAVALNMASAVAAKHPSVLIPYVSEFFVSAGHSETIRNLRMQVLTRICTAAGQKGGIGSKPHARKALLAELREYLNRRENGLAALSARAIGCLATAHPGSTPAIVKVLSSVVGSGNNAAVVTESIAVLRRLLQRHPGAQAKALPQLIAMLLADKENERESIQEPSARASIIWLIGEFYEQVHVVATEALRLLARGFAGEAAEVKLQILNLAAKIVAWSRSEDEEIAGEFVRGVSNKVRLQLLEYVVSCARYDKDYDVRDKARIMNYLFLSSEANPKLVNAACKALLSRKPIPPSPDTDGASELEDELASDVVIGSMAHVLPGKRLDGFRPLEPWAQADSDNGMREEISGDGVGAAVNREYKGVSSSDYMGSVSSSMMSSTVWEAPSGISSATVTSNGLGNDGIGFSSLSTAVPAPEASASGVQHLDPDNFYGGAGESSSEYDSDSSDDESEDSLVEGELIPGEIASPSASRAGASSEILINTSDILGNGRVGNGVPSRKPTSEYDLDALLGGLSTSPSAVEKENTLLGATSLSLTKSEKDSRSPWQRILETWNACGLEVDASYSRGSSILGPDATPVVLLIANRGKEMLQDISFSTQCGDRFSCDTRIGSLASGATQEVVTNARFKGKTSGVKFEVRFGKKGICTGEFKPSTGIILRPYPAITPASYLEAEKRLTGMFSSETRLTVKPPQHNDWMGLSTRVKNAVMSVAFVSHIKTSVGGDEEGERFSCVFGGWLPGEERRMVLVRVRVGEGGSGCWCNVWIGCEDALFSANLKGAVKTILASMKDDGI